MSGSRGGPEATPEATPEAITDPALAEALVAHWAARADLDYIEKDLRRRGKDRSALTVADLASYDQLHAGQLTATRDFAAWVGLAPDSRVLDLGAGLGGAARLLAAEHGCRVQAVELSEPLHETGTELTRWLGLTPLVQHRRADLLAWKSHPLPFDVVWLQHVDMHVPHKGALYAAARRRLDPRGRVVWHDWLAGAGGAPWYPVPWSDDARLSFLSPRQRFLQDTGDAGLELARLEDITERTHGWFSQTLGGLRKALGGLPEEAARRRARFTALVTRMENILRNLDEQRLLPIYAEASPR